MRPQNVRKNQPDKEREKMLTMTDQESPSKIDGVLSNKYPCCHRPTRFHEIENYKEGDERLVTCSRDGRRWKITFVITQVKSLRLLKLVWEELGGGYRHE